jgi:hypothetical protein
MMNISSCYAQRMEITGETLDAILTALAEQLQLAGP